MKMDHLIQLLALSGYNIDDTLIVCNAPSIDNVICENGDHTLMITRIAKSKTLQEVDGVVDIEVCANA